MATYSGILAWKIPWTEFGGLQYMGLQRIGHNSASEQIYFFLFLSMESTINTLAHYFPSLLWPLDCPWRFYMWPCLAWLAE